MSAAFSAPPSFRAPSPTRSCAAKACFVGQPALARRSAWHGNILIAENGGDKLVTEAAGFPSRGRSKTLPPVAFDLF